MMHILDKIRKSNTKLSLLLILVSAFFLYIGIDAAVLFIKKIPQSKVIVDANFFMLFVGWGLFHLRRWAYIWAKIYVFCYLSLSLIAGIFFLFDSYFYGHPKHINLSYVQLVWTLSYAMCCLILMSNRVRTLFKECQT